MTVFQGIDSYVNELETFERHPHWNYINLDQQILILNKFTFRKPDDTSAWLALGICFFLIEEDEFLNDCILCLKKHLSFYPIGNQSFVYEIIGGCYALQGDYVFSTPCTAVDNWFLRSKRINHVEFAGRYSNVVTYTLNIRQSMQKGEFHNLRTASSTNRYLNSELHCDLYRKFVPTKLNGKSIAYKYYKDADIYLDNKNYNAALQSLKTALEFDKNNDMIYESIGLTYSLLEHSDFSKAVENYEKAIDIDPMNTNYMFGSLRPLIEIKQYKRAMQLLDAAEILGDPLAPSIRSQIEPLCVEYLKSLRHSTNVFNINKMSMRRFFGI